MGSDDGSLSLWRLDSSECLARRRMHSFIFCHLFFQLCEVCSPRWLCLGSACRLGRDPRDRGNSSHSLWRLARRLRRRSGRCPGPSTAASSSGTESRGSSASSAWTALKMRRPFDATLRTFGPVPSGSSHGRVPSNSSRSLTAHQDPHSQTC